MKKTITIEAQSNVLKIPVREIIEYKDLILLFVYRDFVSTYKQTVLGPLWIFLAPLLTTTVFIFVFGNIAKLPTDGAPKVVFYLLGVTCWGFFAECFTKCSSALVDGSNLFRKVYFPRMIVPISIVISGLIRFSIQFIVFLLVLYFFIATGDVEALTTRVVWFPFLLCIMAILSLGLGLLFSALTTKYRDLRHLLQFGVQLLMYATPVIYPLSLLSDRAAFYVMFNPLTGVFESIKYIFLNVGTISTAMIVWSVLFSLIVLLIGVVAFNKVEQKFVDTI